MPDSLRRPAMAPLAALCCGLLLAAVLPAAAQQEPPPPKIETVPVADGIWMLVGQGGNIGVSAGEDGVFLIDDQYAPVTPAIRAAVAALGDRPIRFVLNTHWHGDHTGGNENLGGAGVVIVAHDNVRKRLSSEQFITALDVHVSPSPRAALPIVTYADAVTLHLNGDDVRAFHVPPAHTDGDSVVHFTRGDVIHAGDVYFAGMYPFVDVSSGGDVDGMIGAVDTILGLAGESTKIIPGHGPLSSRAELAKYGAMLRGVRGAVAALLAQGKGRDEVIAAHPSAPWDDVWGGGFTKPDTFVGYVYDSLTAAER